MPTHPSFLSRCTGRKMYYYAELQPFGFIGTRDDVGIIPYKMDSVGHVINDFILCFYLLQPSTRNALPENINCLSSAGQLSEFTIWVAGVISDHGASVPKSNRSPPQIR